MTVTDSGGPNSPSSYRDLRQAQQQQRRRHHHHQLPSCPICLQDFDTDFGILQLHRKKLWQRVLQRIWLLPNSRHSLPVSCSSCNAVVCHACVVELQKNDTTNANNSSPNSLINVFSPMITTTATRKGPVAVKCPICLAPHAFDTASTNFNRAFASLLEEMRVMEKEYEQERIEEENTFSALEKERVELQVKLRLAEKRVAQLEKQQQHEEEAGTTTTTSDEQPPQCGTMSTSDSHDADHATKQSLAKLHAKLKKLQHHIEIRACQYETTASSALSSATTGSSTMEPAETAHLLVAETLSAFSTAIDHIQRLMHEMSPKSAFVMGDDHMITTNSLDGLFPVDENDDDDDDDDDDRRGRSFEKDLMNAERKILANFSHHVSRQSNLLQELLFQLQCLSLAVGMIVTGVVFLAWAVARAPPGAGSTSLRWREHLIPMLLVFAGCLILSLWFTLQDTGRLVDRLPLSRRHRLT